jgi:hypothetical protein
MYSNKNNTSVPDVFSRVEVRYKVCKHHHGVQDHHQDALTKQFHELCLISSLQRFDRTKDNYLANSSIRDSHDLNYQSIVVNNDNRN